MNEPVTIDPEFQSLIPPLSADEYSQLEKNCKKDGILDSLKVWHGVLIDGHNRFRISEEWDLNYRIEEMDFPDRQAVIRWIILNQFGRRNLSAYDRSLLALKLKPVIKEQAEQRMLSGKKDPTQKSAEGETRQRLAKVAGVSHDTIHKVETIEAKAPESVKEQVKSGEKSINQAYLEIKNKERKKIDFSAKAHLEAAKERHGDFKQKDTVTMDEVRQDKKDQLEIANGKASEIINALKKIIFIGAMLSGGDFDLSMLAKSDDAKRLSQDLSLAEATIEKIKEGLISGR